MKTILGTPVPFKIREKINPKKDKVTLYGVFVPLMPEDKANLAFMDSTLHGDKDGDKQTLHGDMDGDSKEEYCKLLYLGATRVEVENFCRDAIIVSNYQHYKAWCGLHEISDIALKTLAAKDEYLRNNYQYLAPIMNQYRIAPISLPLETVTAAMRGFYACGELNMGSKKKTALFERENEIFQENLEYGLFEILHKLSLEKLVVMKAQVDTLAKKTEEAIRGKTKSEDDDDDDKKDVDRDREDEEEE